MKMNKSKTHSADVKFAFNSGTDPITCHAFNADSSQIILSRNNNEAEIYEVSVKSNVSNFHRSGTSSGSWKLKNKLSAHDLRVTGVDWAPNSNRIVTCSADRNAYVWTYDKSDNEWKKTLVLLRTNRAATCVKWSPNEKKFAVGCGARLVAVCYFDEENDWWLSKHIKKPIKSAVTSVDWHPENRLLAVGSCDLKARLFSALVKELDSKKKKNGDINSSQHKWIEKIPSFGHQISEWPSNGWLHAIRFSKPNGNRLCWVSHDGTISVVDCASAAKVITLRTKYLPFLSVCWLSEAYIIAAGHDYSPVLFFLDSAGGKLVQLGKMDEKHKEKNGQDASPIDEEEAAKMSAREARSMFENLSSKGWVVGDNVDRSVGSLHQNTITQVSLLPKALASAAGSKNLQFSTSGQDGLLALWETQSLEAGMAGLKI